MDKAAVFTAQQIFEEDAKRKGKFGERTKALLLQLFEAVNFEDLRANAEFIASTEGICCGNGHSDFLSRINGLL